MTDPEHPERDPERERTVPMVGRYADGRFDIHHSDVETAPPDHIEDDGFTYVLAELVGQPGGYVYVLVNRRLEEQLRAARQGLPCDHCDGKGTISGTRHWNYGTRWEWKSYTEACPRCDGTGVLTESKLARIAEGREARTERIGRGLNLAQAAAERGMTTPEYSAFERGLTP